MSFDKLPCLHRDIPLTQPLVIVYTASHQSWRALSDFHSNIHSASEVVHPKWLDRSSLFFPLSCCPLSPPMAFLSILASFPERRHDSASDECTNTIYRLLLRVCDEDNIWKWTILVHLAPFPNSHFGFCMMGLLIPFDADRVMGHSVSEGIKKMSTCFAGCCLLLPLIILIKYDTFKPEIWKILQWLDSYIYITMLKVGAFSSMNLDSQCIIDEKKSDKKRHRALKVHQK